MNENIDGLPLESYNKANHSSVYTHPHKQYMPVRENLLKSISPAAGYWNFLTVELDKRKASNYNSIYRKVINVYASGAGSSGLLMSGQLLIDFFASSTTISSTEGIAMTVDSKDLPFPVHYNVLFNGVTIVINFYIPMMAIYNTGSKYMQYFVQEMFGSSCDLDIQDVTETYHHLSNIVADLPVTGETYSFLPKSGYNLVMCNDYYSGTSYVKYATFFLPATYTAMDFVVEVSGGRTMMRNTQFKVRLERIAGNIVATFTCSNNMYRAKMALVMDSANQYSLYGLISNYQVQTFKVLSVMTETDYQSGSSPRGTGAGNWGSRLRLYTIPEMRAAAITTLATPITATPEKQNLVLADSSNYIWEITVSTAGVLTTTKLT